MGFVRRAGVASLPLILAYTTMATSSCSTTETKTKPEKPASSGGSTEEQTRQNVARVGDTLTLKGGSGEKMEVTVLRVADPLQAGEYDQPEGGYRFVGVYISLRNVGSAQYDDSPSNGAALLTMTDERANDTIVSGGDCGSDFASSAKIAPGSREVVAFRSR
jgi:Domain of unknown function (DUF4352)